MKKRYIDRLAEPERPAEQQEHDLGELLNAHLDAETRARWSARLAADGVHRAPASERPRIAWRRPWLAAAAAVAVLAVVAWWLWPRPETPARLADDYVRQDGPLHLPSGFRGNDQADADRRVALEAYENRDYRGALNALAAVPLVDSTAHGDLMLRGLCHFFLDDNRQAAQYFEQAGAYRGALEPERQWYLALAYLRLNDTDAARPVLAQAAANAASPYAQRAQTILAKIDR